MTPTTRQREDICLHATVYLLDLQIYPKVFHLPCTGKRRVFATDLLQNNTQGGGGGQIMTPSDRSYRRHRCLPGFGGKTGKACRDVGGSGRSSVRPLHWLRCCVVLFDMAHCLDTANDGVTSSNATIYVTMLFCLAAIHPTGKGLDHCLVPPYPSRFSDLWPMLPLQLIATTLA